MLAEIRIEGLGVIREADATFDPGLTVVTGETGAGKTMVVSSLRLLSGERADADRVRRGAKRAIVEGRFRTDSLDNETVTELAQVLESASGERDDDGSVIAIRTVNADGGSRASLGGRGVPAGVLGEFTRTVLTVHGQNDQLRLRRPDQQRHALDRFAGPPVLDKLAKYRKLRTRWLALSDELVERTQHARELAQEADRLQHALTEIDAVAPEAGEDDHLVAEVRRLSGLDILRDVVQNALGSLDGDEDGAAGAIAGLSAAKTRLEASHDPDLAKLAARLDDALTAASDISAELASFAGRLFHDPAELDRLLERQAKLKALIRKYGADADGVIAWAVEARERLTHLDTSSEAIESLSAAVADAAKQVATQASALGAARHKAAERLGADVSTEMAGLAMGKATLEVSVSPSAGSDGARDSVSVDGEWLKAGVDGTDNVEFALRAHTGAAALPLTKSASGGELSRVMLALELVLSASDAGTTMVFDEVDAGVGGRAAVEIGRRLARLARSHQVIVVTHLPQVAAFGNAHLVVDKDVGSDSVNSTVRNLTEADRVVELARMLAGLDDTDSGRAHAEELLATANAERAGWD